MRKTRSRTLWWRALIGALAAAVLITTGILYFSRDTPPPPRIIITKISTIYPLWTDLGRGPAG